MKTAGEDSVMKVWRHLTLSHVGLKQSMGVPSSSFIFNIVLKVLAKVMTRKGNIRKWIGKEEIKTLFICSWHFLTHVEDLLDPLS